MILVRLGLPRKRLEDGQGVGLETLHASLTRRFSRPHSEGGRVLDGSRLVRRSSSFLCFRRTKSSIAGRDVLKKKADSSSTSAITRSMPRMISVSVCQSGTPSHAAPIGGRCSAIVTMIAR